jgi:pimeloyl-ACP methyl ester carboxylesterase
MKPIRSLTFALALAAGLAQNQTTKAADVPSDFRVGTMTVRHHGDHGRPLILIPGLAGGGWVWDDTVARLKKDHVLYVVTLAGFDGAAPVPGRLLELAGDSLLQLIRTQHLDRPVLIGHSLGGTLSIQFAEAHSDLIAGVVAVDGLPVFPGTEGVPADQRAKMGEDMRAQLAGATPEQFGARQMQFMRTMGTLSEARAVELAAHASRSDPAATAQYMSEDMALDLRAGLASIGVPVLEISPYNAADFSNPARPISEAQKTAYYAALLQGTPKLEVVSIAPARHFVMFDQPDAFAAALTRFLAALPVK